jgi:hypothetical protein
MNRILNYYYNRDLTTFEYESKYYTYSEEIYYSSDKIFDLYINGTLISVVSWIEVHLK